MGKLRQIVGRAADFCERRPKWLPWALAALAILVPSPSLLTGFSTDDRLFQITYQGRSVYPEIKLGVLDVFAFSGRTSADRQKLVDRGLVPWWTAADWRVAFWRPLSALTHWLDWQAFGGRAWPMHAENLVLYGLLVALLTVFYRRFLSPPCVVGLAGLLYLLDGAHGMPVGWIASRNGILATLFVVLTLYFHDRWRRDGWRPGMVLAWCSLSLGLLSGEAAVAAGGYLAAYALFIDRGRPFRRFAALFPYLVLVVVWQSAYKHLGYGAVGARVYIDPAQEPVHFLVTLLTRLPLLLFAQMAGGEPALCNFFPPAVAGVCLAVAVGFLVFATWVLWPLLKRDPVARFWAVGMALAAVPSCGAMPQSRLLFCAGIGGMALIAQFLVWRSQGATAAKTKAYRSAATALAVVWVACHLVVSTVMMPIASGSMAFIDTVMEREIRCVPDDPELRESTVVVVSAQPDIWVSGLITKRAGQGEAVPQYGRQLCAGTRRIEVSRSDDRTLILEPDREFLSNGWTGAFRNLARDPMHAGDTFDVTGLHIEVKSVRDDGGPQAILFRFDKPLEDPSLCWIVYDKGTYGLFTPPRVGERVSVTSPSLLELARSCLGL